MGIRLAETLKTRTLVALLAVTMLLASAAGGTVAWLQSGTHRVNNTFTVGAIDISLTETDTGLDGDEDENTNRYTMDVGTVIAKDPTVHVNGGSLDCWLYVKVSESENFADFMAYALADGWTPLGAEPGIYWREVYSMEEIQSFPVLKDHAVQMKEDVTPEALALLTETEYPTLTFTAYAMQRSLQAEATATAENAWAALMGDMQ